MQRRGFLKLTLATVGSLLMPKYIYASGLDLSNIQFSATRFDEQRQTIIVFLAGGPSLLSGNLSNLDEINNSSQNDYYKHFGSTMLTNIEGGYDLWEQAGGQSMKNMLDNNEMTLIRTCYSAEREALDNKSHNLCSQQNMRGNYDLSKPGLLTTLSRVMDNNGKLNGLDLPFMALNGKDGFYAGDPADGLNPVSIDYDLSNPFTRNVTSGAFYTKSETENKDYEEYSSIKPLIDDAFDKSAKSMNSVLRMNEFLTNRKTISEKIDTVSSDRNDGSNQDKNLDAYGYTQNEIFHKTLASAIELLDATPTTRTITVGTGGLGGWDDHSFCKYNYTRRMQSLFQGLEAGMRHLDGIGKKNKISIIVFGEFGRNTNLNISYGWDHGNLQNLFILGGTDYFNHVGGTDAIVGETVVDNGGKAKSGRLWVKPKEGSYVCEPLSIAATIYAIHGISNPEALTGGYGVINPTINGADFFKS